MFKLKRFITLKNCLYVCAVWLLFQFIVYLLPDSRSASTDTGWFSWSWKLARSFSGSHNKNGFGDMGRPVYVPASLQAEAEATFAKNQFNLVVSDLIGPRRNLPDFRDKTCPNIPVTDSLIAWKTSVIIVFHNEAISTLLRTVTSVIDRTPPALLEEIILVDDASTREELGAMFEEEIAKLHPDCHVVRMGERSGLVRARLKGAQGAKGKTLTFLDAHCEATQGWLEPLLEQIAEDPHRVVCPIIDVINDHTFEYSTGLSTIWGTFDWQLSFHWNPISDEEKKRTKGDPRIPVRSPAMAGGLFTMSRDYFYELGSYDPGMVVWGGENVEMSLRIWQCGGELLIAPCSRVGHVFRKVTPHEWPGGVHHVLALNSLRTAYVWMDEYRQFYLEANPFSKTVDFGDISEREALRKKLNCKNFKWYLDNVFVSQVFPSEIIGLGEVRHLQTSMCLDSMGKGAEHPVSIITCHGVGGNQAFAWTPKGILWSSQGCVSWDGQHLVFIRCDSPETDSRTFDFIDQKLILRSNQLCLGLRVSGSTPKVVLEECKNEPEFQWKIPVPNP